MTFHNLVGSLALFLAASAAVSTAAAASSGCQFCSSTGSSSSVVWDLSSIPNTTHTVVDAATSISYLVTSPCANAQAHFGECCSDSIRSPATQAMGSRCYDLGALGSATKLVPAGKDGSQGFNLTLNNPDGVQAANCGSGYRTSTFVFQCDATAPVDNPPSAAEEGPRCHYTFTWSHPAACGKAVPTPCTTPNPPQPAPPASNESSCTPRWKPTWDMKRSTILYACNSSGFHSVDQAVQYGVVVYDWSNAKAIWANARPMVDEELLTKQAEMVLAADPGIPGQQPRVWVYRNTIKALNWYTSVREKLDDPQYEGWFVKFKDYQGPSSNNSYHVPACTYGKCSGFYHDQEQTPEYPHGDGSCREECDCGNAPCGEYIFDLRNASLRSWYINEYMVSNETLLHEPISIGLGWLDDSMKLTGPTEEDKHFIEDTGSSAEVMQEYVYWYKATIAALAAKVVPMGGFWWQLIRGSTPGVKEMGASQADQCAATLRSWCVAEPPQWSAAQKYEVDPTDVVANATEYTAEFLLTRGPYAWLGFGWKGCGGTDWPRPSLWDVDYGTPVGPCKETGDGTMQFTREWTKGTVTWDCHTAKGTITPSSA